MRGVRLAVVLLVGCLVIVGLLAALSSGAPADPVSQGSLGAPMTETPVMQAAPSRAPATPATAAPAAAAQAAKLWEAKGCIACHDLEQPAMGPPIRGAWGSRRTLEGGGEVTVDEAYIRRSLKEPSAQVVAGYPDQMQAQDLTEEEIAGIISLYKSMAAPPSH